VIAIYPFLKLFVYWHADLRVLVWKPSMSNLLVLAVCNEPRTLKLGRTISEIYRKELLSV
jgi:hypothetical protein